MMERQVGLQTDSVVKRHQMPCCTQSLPDREDFIEIRELQMEEIGEIRQSLANLST
jgi:hypothetical protein